MAIPFDGTVALLAAVNNKTIGQVEISQVVPRDGMRGRHPDSAFHRLVVFGRALAHSMTPIRTGPVIPRWEPAESRTHSAITGEAPIL